MNWLILLDKSDTNDVVSMVEHTGTSYLPICDDMMELDLVYVATTEYGGRVLYKLNIDKMKGWTSPDDGEVLCDAHATQPMLISDSLLLSEKSLSSIKKDILYTPQELDTDTAFYLLDIFSNEKKYSAENSVDVKSKIIYTAYAAD